MHKLIHAEGMKIIGIMGDGSKTSELWEAFEEGIVEMWIPITKI